MRGLFLFSIREAQRLVAQSCWDNLMISVRITLSFCSAIRSMFLFLMSHCGLG